MQRGRVIRNPAFLLQKKDEHHPLGNLFNFIIIIQYIYLAITNNEAVRIMK